MKRLLLSLFLVAAWVAPAVAQPVDEGSGAVSSELAAVPKELRAGENVTVSGEGCAPGNDIGFKLYDPELASSTSEAAQGDGTFVYTLRIPPSAKLGRAWLRASCLTSESDPRVMEAVLLISRPRFVITWTNILFGLGTALITAGFGLAMLKKPARRHPTSSRRPTRGKQERTAPEASRAPPTEVDQAPSFNGTRTAGETVEAE